MTPTLITTIVFDIGNVLVRWDPVAAFLPLLGDRDRVLAFLDRVDFGALNRRADGGASFDDLAMDIADPQDQAVFLSYVPNHAASVVQVVPGTWDLLGRLAARGHALHAITNWAAETWPVGLAAHPRLATAFGTTVVSGIEGVLKPDPRIFAILCDRAGVAPGDCLFIDDSAANVTGARAFGMAGHHFTDAATLERDLTDRGLI